MHVVTSVRPDPVALHLYTFPSWQCTASGVHTFDGIDGIDWQVPLAHRLLFLEQSVVVWRVPSSPQTATKSPLHVGIEPGAHSTHAGPRFVSAHAVPAAHAAGHTAASGFGDPAAGTSGSGSSTASGAAEADGAVETDGTAEALAALEPPPAALEDVLPAGELTDRWHPHTRKRTAPRVQGITGRRMRAEHTREPRARQPRQGRQQQLYANADALREIDFSVCDDGVGLGPRQRARRGGCPARCGTAPEVAVAADGPGARLVVRY
jgi:hypothetical protein